MGRRFQSAPIRTVSDAQFSGLTWGTGAPTSCEGPSENMSHRRCSATLMSHLAPSKDSLQRTSAALSSIFSPCSRRQSSFFLTSLLWLLFPSGTRASLRLAVSRFPLTHAMRRLRPCSPPSSRLQTPRRPVEWIGRRGEDGKGCFWKVDAETDSGNQQTAGQQRTNKREFI